VVLLLLVVVVVVMLQLVSGYPKESGNFYFLEV